MCALAHLGCTRAAGTSYLKTDSKVVVFAAVTIDFLGLLKKLQGSNQKEQKYNFVEMDILQKDLFCTLCSLKFHTNRIYGLHLKLVHKVTIEKESNKNQPKSNSNTLPNIVGKSDLSEEMVPLTMKRKHTNVVFVNITVLTKKT